MQLEKRLVQVSSGRTSTLLVASEAGHPKSSAEEQSFVDWWGVATGYRSSTQPIPSIYELCIYVAMYVCMHACMDV